MQLHRGGNDAEAARMFRDLIAAGYRDPNVFSYGGLLVATVEGDVKNGLAWCERGMEMAFDDAQMYLNLARLHEQTAWKTQAIQVLRQGLRIDPGSKKLQEAINRLSPRSPHAIPALRRDHVVNRTLGKLRAKGKEEVRIRRKTSSPSYS